MFKKSRIKIVFQHDQMDCGPACLKMIAGYYKKEYSLDYLRNASYLSRNGVSLTSLSDASQKIGFRSLMVKLNFKKLIADCPLPCILHWNQDHFIVLNKITTGGVLTKKRKELHFEIADPAHGIILLDQETFLKNWYSTEDEKGTALLLEPTPDFYSQPDKKNTETGYFFLLKYLRPYRKYIIQLFVGMIGASLISLAFPLLTQLLIDNGINGHNINIIYLVLLSQLFLFFGSTAINMIQNWLVLQVNARVSLNIISDFLIKLLQLPIKYFDSKSVGDISQRLNDHHRIDSFLTGMTLSSVFSLVSIIVYSVLLGFYDPKILVTFLGLSLFAIVWILLFQNKRKQIDYKKFTENKVTQDKLFEMITGMQEIKLYGSETAKRWEWENLQVKLFKLNVKSLSIEQLQQGGFVFFSQLKNILISFFAAEEVLAGRFSIGVLLSISYIIGQTNGPLEQLIAFVRAAQDAKLSLERMQDIHQKDEENTTVSLSPVQNKDLEQLGDIIMENVSFQYEGPHSPMVLKNINLVIPKGKITAIVGASGSGKTTLLKLLLNFYKPITGQIIVGDTDLSQINPSYWRELSGTVMQDGYIFSDTISNNIILNGKEINIEKMERAVSIANLEEFVEKLPLKYTTKIGTSGMGLSGGQKQRIFIARSVYKDPKLLLFDEATSSLDANNEKMIMENLSTFFKDKTVLIIAHRLSTVKNADQIIVLDRGEVVEIGTHQVLSNIKGNYYSLVKNQLELGD